MIETVTAAELGKILGVNLRTIQRLTQEGILPWMQDPSDKRKKQYPLAESVQAFVRRQTGLIDKDERRKRLEDIEEKKLSAEAELKESQKTLHQLKTDIASGKLIPLEQVQDDYIRFFGIFKKFVQGLPPRIAAKLSGYVDPVAVRGIEQDIAREIDASLRSFVVAGKTMEAR